MPACAPFIQLASCRSSLTQDGMSVAKRLMLMLAVAIVLLLACSHTAHAHTQVPSAVAPDEAAATAASVASESAPATVAFVDSSVSLDVAAGVAVDPELSSQFLLHHIKAQRTFSSQWMRAESTAAAATALLPRRRGCCSTSL